MSSAFGLPLLLLLGEWAYQHFNFEAVFRGCCHLCSVHSCRDLRSTQSISRFCLQCLLIGLTFLGEGFQDGISLSGVVSLHPSLYFNSPFLPANCWQNYDVWDNTMVEIFQK